MFSLSVLTLQQPKKSFKSYSALILKQPILKDITGVNNIKEVKLVSNVYLSIVFRTFFAMPLNT